MALLGTESIRQTGDSPKKVIPQLKVMWKMNRLRKMYRDGVPIETISKLYKDVR